MTERHTAESVKQIVWAADAAKQPRLGEMEEGELLEVIAFLLNEQERRRGWIDGLIDFGGGA